jgi:hypothetical protein
MKAPGAGVNRDRCVGGGDRTLALVACDRVLNLADIDVGQMRRDPTSLDLNTFSADTGPTLLKRTARPG